MDQLKMLMMYMNSLYSNILVKKNKHLIYIV